MADRQKNGFLKNWLFTSIAVLAAAKIVPGIECQGWGTLLVAALLLGVFNAVLKPILFLLTLPLQLLTLGLFTLVINAMLLMLTSQLVKDFYVGGFWPAFFGGLLISVVSGFLNLFFGGSGQRIQANVYTSGAPSGNPPPRREQKDLGDGPMIDV